MAREILIFVRIVHSKASVRIKDILMTFYGVRLLLRDLTNCRGTSMKRYYVEIA